MPARSPHRSARTVSTRARSFKIAAAGAVTLLGLAAAAMGQAPAAPPGGGTRGPMETLFARDGKTAYVAEFDTGDVAIVDAARGTVVGHMPTGGTEPTA